MMYHPVHNGLHSTVFQHKCLGFYDNIIFDVILERFLNIILKTHSNTLKCKIILPMKSKKRENLPLLLLLYTWEETNICSIHIPSPLCQFLHWLFSTLMIKDRHPLNNTIDVPGSGGDINGTYKRHWLRCHSLMDFPPFEI